MIASHNTRIINYFFLTLFIALLLNYIPYFFLIKITSPVYQLAPAIVALLFWNFYEEKDDFKTIWNKRIQFSKKPTLIVFIVTILPIVIIPLTMYLFERKITFQDISFGLIFWSIFGAFTEEVGWRGYIQYKIGTKTNILISTFFTALMWFACQFQFFLEPDILRIVILFFFMLSFSLILSYIFYSTGKNIIFGFFFHAIHNIMAVFFVNEKMANIDIFFVITTIYFILAVLLVYKNQKLFQLEQI